MVVYGQRCLQITVKPLNLRSLRVIWCGREMPNAPREAQIIEPPRLRTDPLSDTIDWGTPKVGKNFSRMQFFMTSDEIFLTGYMDTNLEKPSSATKMSMFLLLLLTVGPKKSINILSRGLVTISLL
jgi:hypothetical protein